MVAVTEADIGRTVIHCDPAEEGYRCGATVLRLTGGMVVIQHHLTSDGPITADPAHLEWPRQVIIEETRPGHFTVREGDRWNDSLNFDEMLGSVIALTHPHLPARPVPYGGLRSAEEHEADRLRQVARIQERKQKS